ncbi:unnamed protein product, partial [Musa acuminata var. zebrina]
LIDHSRAAISKTVVSNYRDDDDVPLRWMVLSVHLLSVITVSCIHSFILNG